MPASELQLIPARVMAVDEDNRVLTVKFDGTERTVSQVRVISDYGSYSFPRESDRVVVIYDGVYAYCIGKLEYGYKEKIEGDADGVRVKDPQSKTEIIAKKVLGGEVHLSNLVKRVFMHIANSGDFYLMNGLGEGLRYFNRNKFLRLAGKFVHILGNSVNVQIGSVARDIPSQGKVVMPSDAGPTIPAIEAMIELVSDVVTKLRLARLHLGHVKNSLGVDEFGSWGARIRAIIEVCTAGVPIGVLKIDESGNVELSSSVATTMLDGLLVQLGGTSSAHPVVFGDALLAYLNTHTHKDSMGVTSTPVIPADSSLHSTKVFTS